MLRIDNLHMMDNGSQIARVINLFLCPLQNTSNFLLFVVIEFKNSSGKTVRQVNIFFAFCCLSCSFYFEHLPWPHLWLLLRYLHFNRILLPVKSLSGPTKWIFHSGLQMEMQPHGRDISGEGQPSVRTAGPAGLTQGVLRSSSETGSSNYSWGPFTLWLLPYPSSLPSQTSLKRSLPSLTRPCFSFSLSPSYYSPFPVTSLKSPWQTWAMASGPDVFSLCIWCLSNLTLNFLSDS